MTACEENIRQSLEQTIIVEENSLSKHIDFSTINSIFRFSAEVPAQWQVELVPEIESINIYNPDDPAGQTIDKSQIFIRYFQADSFLTLSTVDILQQENLTVNDHSAVKYQIQKKPSIDNFSRQPIWRNEIHDLIDVRFSGENPSTFYVFSYNPSLGQPAFEKFLNSVIFHNDPASYHYPLENSMDRISKKPFGINISPQDSPVQPEKFSGFHTGTDYEITESELDQNVPVHAICGGTIGVKRSASGYGGVLVQNCVLENQPVTVIYGHLNLQSISKEAGEYLVPGEQFAMLGAHESSETDGERKHLHLSIHKGAGTDIRGYVQNESELSNWIDPQSVY